jgi:hypothetical protein
MQSKLPLATSRVQCKIHHTVLGKYLITLVSQQGHIYEDCNTCIIFIYLHAYSIEIYLQETNKPPSRHRSVYRESNLFSSKYKTNVLRPCYSIVGDKM